MKKNYRLNGAKCASKNNGNSKSPNRRNGHIPLTIRITREFTLSSLSGHPLESDMVIHERKVYTGDEIPRVLGATNSKGYFNYGGVKGKLTEAKYATKGDAHLGENPHYTGRALPWREFQDRGRPSRLRILTKQVVL